jgi:4-amino-4-deoxy-L-arabinose transferase-like glycosyltransferase
MDSLTSELEYDPEVRMWGSQWTMIEPTTKPVGRSKAFTVTAIAVLALVAVVLRLIYLNSDPYPWLDWDTGLLTDEGFYLHNARNVALFGHARTDDFNNMLLAPVVHALHTAVFSIFGFGLVQARATSAVLSIFTLLIFGSAMRRVFGDRPALIAMIILGLDHTSFLFNRMALLDTPTEMFAVCAFWLYVRYSSNPYALARILTALAAGAMIAAAAVTRSICLCLLPAPLLADWFSVERVHRRHSKNGLAAIVLGAVGAFGLYYLFWYFPHRQELGGMYHYYRTAQVQPHSLVEMMSNIKRFLIGQNYSTVSYLILHTPLLFAMSLFGARLSCMWMRDKADKSDYGWPGSDIRQRAGGIFLTVWLLGCLIVLAVSSYSPARYLVTSIPAMAGLAAITLSKLWESKRRRPAVKVISALWLSVNLIWVCNWGLTLQFTQAEASAWLSKNLPIGSVLIGDVAPGVSVDTPFVAVNVQDGLCNDKRPVERFRPVPRYLVILNEPGRERFWERNYPELISKERQIKELHVMRWKVGVYKVPN